jgi:hypothetical protein
LLDPWCRTIISIDKRTPTPPDDRPESLYYEGNSTASMLDQLRRVAPDELGKVICFDADAKDIPAGAIAVAPDFCLIDGEHTYAAALSDFEFCLDICAPNAAICFHDDFIIYDALGAVIALLRRRGIPFSARKLEGVTFGIFLRDCNAVNDPFIRSRSSDGLRWVRWRQARALARKWIKRSSS